MFFLLKKIYQCQNIKRQRERTLFQFGSDKHWLLVKNQFDKKEK